MKVIVTDDENNFKSCKESLGHRGVELQQCAPEQHQAVIERAIRTLKERVRTVYHSLQYVLSLKLLPFLISYCIQRINFAPNNKTNGISPMQIILGKKISMRHYLRAEFGDILLCKKPNISKTKEMEPRTEHVVFLYVNLNSNGSMRVYSLDRDRFCNRIHFVSTPLTADTKKILQERAQSNTPVVWDDPSLDQQHAADAVEVVPLPAAAATEAHPAAVPAEVPVPLSEVVPAELAVPPVGGEYVVVTPRSHSAQPAAAMTTDESHEDVGSRSRQHPSCNHHLVLLPAQVVSSTSSLLMRMMQQAKCHCRHYPKKS